MFILLSIYLRSQWLSGEAGTTLRFTWWITAVQLHCSANAAAPRQRMPLRRD